MLYSEIGKDELGRPKRLFHFIYDYQSIVELKMWSINGNYDRVSEMIIRALQWKLCDVEAAKELAHRKQIIKDRNSIMNRAWF
jgi:2-oxo-4-hydroxy-4-carboxy--5-ureidoimidazoline (OHCU) decarboxylase